MKSRANLMRKWMTRVTQTAVAWKAYQKIMNRLLKPVIRLALPFGMVLTVNRVLRAVAASGYSPQYWLQWRIAQRQLGWLDRFINCWHTSRDSSPRDRGTLGLLGMKPGCRILDLCCGDGFYPYHFYSHMAARIIAIDYDSMGIDFAKRHFRLNNVEYRYADIRPEMPDEEFDNCSWDAGIDYFSTSAAELGALLRRFFRNVAVLELSASRLPSGRATLYFYSSDRPVPLDADFGTYLRLS